MGGYGSGRYADRRRRSTIESCLFLSLTGLVDKGLPVRAGVNVRGTLTWQFHDTRKDKAVWKIEVNTLPGRTPGIRLQYAVVPEGRSLAEPLDYWVSLVTTNPPVGGQRWWFVCPLTRSGCACQRRVGTLYLPDGGRYVGCRHCYDLTYRSTLQSHRAEQLARLCGVPLQVAKHWVWDERRTASATGQARFP